MKNRYPLLPATEPEPFFLHSVLEGKDADPNHRLANRIRFVSTYRGSAHYTFDHPTAGRLSLRYRYAKDVWRNSPQEDGRKNWNFPDRQSFENEVNSAHGLLMIGNHEPADPLTLLAFQEVCGHPEAKTGFYCHLRNRCVPSKPVPAGTCPSHKTWKRKIALQLAEILRLKSQGIIPEALALADKLPTFLSEIRTALNSILPEWNKVILMPTRELKAA